MFGGNSNCAPGALQSFSIFTARTLNYREQYDRVSAPNYLIRQSRICDGLATNSCQINFTSRASEWLRLCRAAEVKRRQRRPVKGFGLSWPFFKQRSKQIVGFFIARFDKKPPS